LPAPPAPAQEYPEAICASLLGGAHPAIELLIALTPGSGVRKASLNLSGSQSDFPGVNRTDGGSVQVYTASGFQLGVRTDGTSAADPDKFSATVDATIGTSAYHEPLTCRITPLPAGLVASAPPAHVLYVSADGSDTAACGRSAPCRQLKRALSLVAPGDGIVVTDGQYVGFDVASVPGTPSSPVRIQAAGDGAEIIPSTNRPDNQDSIAVSASSYVTIEGFRIKPGNRDGMKAVTSPHLTIRRLIVEAQPVTALLFGTCDDAVVEDSDLGGSQIGIQFSDSMRPVARRNHIHGNSQMGALFNGDKDFGRGTITGALVEGNRFHDNAGTGSSALSLDGVQSSTVRNNLFYSNPRRGISVYSMDSTEGSKSLAILGNTVMMPAGSGSGLFLSDLAGPNLVRDNILLHQDAGGAGLEIAATVNLANLDSAANLLQRLLQGASAFTLAAWQSANPPQEAGSLSATPATVFANLPALDFHLAPTSPAIDAGVDLSGLTADIDGRPRPARARTDLGAFELP
jgi:hypothetical protein